MIFFVHLFTHKEGDTSDSNTSDNFHEMHFIKYLMQGIKPHVVSHDSLN